MTIFTHGAHFFSLIFSGAIRNHILQWVGEKNRKLTNGFDFEVLKIVSWLVTSTYTIIIYFNHKSVPIKLLF